MDNAFYKAAQIATYARTLFPEKFADKPLTLRVCAHVHYDSHADQDNAKIDLSFHRNLVEEPVIEFNGARTTDMVDSAFGTVEGIEALPEDKIPAAYERFNNVLHVTETFVGGLESLLGKAFDQDQRRDDQ